MQDDTVQVLRDADQKQQRLDEQKRADTWTINMEANLMNVRRWVKQADAGDELKDQLPLSAVDKVLNFRGTLEKNWGTAGENAAVQRA